MMVLDMLEAKGLDVSFLSFVVLVTLLLLIVMIVVRFVCCTATAKRDRRISSLEKDLDYVEKQLEIAKRPPLYIKDTRKEPGLSIDFPLKRMGYISLSEYTFPELADRYEMAAEFLRDPSQLLNLLVVLDTSEGAFYLPLWEIPAGNPEALDLALKFDPILCGQEMMIFDGFVACDGFRLTTIEFKDEVRAGDTLNVIYNLSGALS
jgi:hypothetical protein